MEIQRRYYMAPLEGITTYVYRSAHAKVYGPLDKYFIPFLQPIEKREFKTRELLEILPENNRGYCAIPQILTIQVEGFLRMADSLQQRGYQEINLNLGCPSRTVVSKNKGSGLLSDPQAVDRLLDGIFEGAGRRGLRISVKTRVGRQSTEQFSQLLQVYNRYPLEELIIHPRLQSDFYHGTPRLELFEEAVQESRNPLCYNGDLFDRDDLAKIQAQFAHQDCYMLGRGLLMRPGMLGPQKDPAGRRKDFEEFHGLIYQGYARRAMGEVQLLHKLKELWVYQIEMFGSPEKLKKRLRKCQSLAEYHAIVRELLDACPIRYGAEA